MSDFMKDMFIEVREKKEPESTSTDLNAIVKIINEVMENLPIIIEDAPTQGELFDPPSLDTVSYSAIPAPSVSELAWASLESNKRSGGIQRADLSQYLDRIEGATLPEKLRSLSALYDEPLKTVKTAAFGETVKEKIANTVSYLVFFKTLTTIITNFNASSAGFNFEAFLAVLLGGKQIPASGATTIADLVTKDNVPISLKLYAEKTAKAGGSYNDLVNDLVRPPYYMQYVVTTKDLSGDDLDRSGTLKFYRYNLSIDNIMAVLRKSAAYENSELIRLPYSVVRGETPLDAEIPEMPTLDDVQTFFHSTLEKEIGNYPWFNELMGEIDYLNNRAIFSGQKKPGVDKISVGQGGRLHRPTARSPLVALLGAYLNAQDDPGFLYFPDKADEGLEGGYLRNAQNIQIIELFGMIYQANELAREAVQGALAARRGFRGTGGWATAEESMSFFNSDAVNLEQRRRALLYTYGASTGKHQYELRRTDIIGTIDSPALWSGKGGLTGVLPSGQEDGEIGQLTIGTQKIQKVLNALITSLNKDVFMVFQQVDILNKNLQGYIAGGLADKDIDKANTAIAASKDIGLRTKKLTKIKE